jgi:hypothetical protein
MLWVIIGVGVFFLAIAFVPNQRNARNILSGYNMMSPDEQAKVNLQGYLRWFRQFHIFLSFTVILFGAVAVVLNRGEKAALLITAYILLAYMVYLWKGRGFFKATKDPGYAAGAVLAAIVSLAFLSIYLLV